MLPVVTARSHLPPRPPTVVLVVLLVLVGLAVGAAPLRADGDDDKARKGFDFGGPDKKGKTDKGKTGADPRKGLGEAVGFGPGEVQTVMRSRSNRSDMIACRCDEGTDLVALVREAGKTLQQLGEG